MLLLLALKWNLLEKAFSCVTTKTNSNFAVKLVEKGHPFIFSQLVFTCSKLTTETLEQVFLLLTLNTESPAMSIWWIKSNICTHVTMECIELNWSCRHMKNVRSSQASVLINSWTELSKTQFFPVRIVSLSSLIRPFFYMIKNSGQRSEYL